MTPLCKAKAVVEMFESCINLLESSCHIRAVCDIIFCREWIVDLEVREVAKGEQSLGARNARWVG